MKKVICAILGIAMLFSMNMTVFAASMPTEDSRLSTEMKMRLNLTSHHCPKLAMQI